MFFLIKNDKIMIKVKGCSDGMKQRTCLYKEDTTLPTVYNEGFKLSCIIGVVEGCEVETADIPGASLQTDH